MNPIFKYRRVAVDFDGTLFEDTGSIDESFQNKQPLAPKNQASDVTQWLKSLGFEILIFTCRPDYHRQYLESQLHANHIAFDYILFYTKPRVDLYIDDKGFRFQNWPDLKHWISLELHKENGYTCPQPDTQFETVLRNEKIKPFLDRAQTFKSVLDVGCGDGSVWRDTPHPFSLTGIEPNDDLRKKANETQLYHQIFPSIDNVDCSQFDCVTALGVLEHVENDTQFLSDFSQAKALYLTVPNAESFHRHIGLKMGILPELTTLQTADHLVGHYRYYTAASLTAVLEQIGTKLGFKIQEWGTTSFKWGSNTQMSQHSTGVIPLFEAAKEVGLTGPFKRYGAELYAFLVKS